MSVGRTVLTGLALCTFVGACDAHISSDQSNDGSAYLRRWKVTDASSKVLSQGCVQQSDFGPTYATNVITVQAAPASVITYEDNFGIEYVEKSRVEKQLPTTDAYWCGNQDVGFRQIFSGTWVGKVEVADADPPATIEKLELVNPQQSPTGGTMADGVRLQLRVQHPGVLHLGFRVPVDLDGGLDGGVEAGADAGTQLGDVYPAMTIE